MITADGAARYMVNYCIDEGFPISNLQLQKILYFCQLESYRRINKPLFNDDFEAWRYGPVIPSVYRIFSIFSGLEIKRRVKETEDLPLSARSLIEDIAGSLHSLRPWELVKKTHDAGSPWDITFQRCGMGSVISKDLIADAAHKR